MTRRAEGSNETVWLISECQINSAGSLPEQNTKLHGGINRRVDLILWLEQCPETIERWLGHGKVKNEFCNELYVIQNKFGYTTGDKNYVQILAALPKAEAMLLEKC